MALSGTRTLAVAVVAALATSACGAAASLAPPRSGPVVASLTQQGVEVDLRWAAGTGSTAVLAATFTPLQKGFHLYSVALPPDGVQGVGRPSRVDVGGGLTAVGPPTVDQVTSPLHVAGLDAPVPVYPDGPITVRLPVQLSPDRPALAWVSYAACSPSTCLPPVTRHPLGLVIPGSA